MRRRGFLQAAAGAAGLIAAPAIAQTTPPLRWRLTSAFPKSLDTLYGGAETFARYVSETTEGKFQIQVFAPGEIVGTLQAADAVSNGTVECAHTGSYYYFGKDPAFAFGTTIPFGLNPRQTNAWYYHGGGNDLLNEFYAKHAIHALPAGSTGTQMGGWYRREIKSLQDLQGLKFRIGGLAGQVLAKLGVVPQQIPAGDTYPALERGTLDAAEFVGPYDDEKLGFAKVAPFYYYPGWWDGTAGIQLFINKGRWEELPKVYKSVVEAAAGYTNVDMLAKYDARNPGALRRLVGAGAQLRPFPQEIMEAALKASNELYDEISTRNPDFKKIYDHYRAFRSEQYLWTQVADYTYDTFMIRTRTRT